MSQTLHSLSELHKLEAFKSLNPTLAKEQQMENVVGYYNARVSHYMHNKRFGFCKVDLPEGTTLDFDVVNNGETLVTKGVPLTADTTIEAFVHASVVASAGYEYGLNEGDEIPVKIDIKEKGVQVTKIRSKNNNTNEPRPSNEFLTFVYATVKMYEHGKFGFVSIEHDFKTGELLDKPVDAYFNHYLLEKAQYTDGVKKDDVLVVKYYTYPGPKKSSAVTLIQYKERSDKMLADAYAAEAAE